ncbi:uncharacterized protein A4U43_C02F8980 [Asparagus officinalis]|uniref:Protein kinase domain-containing protein n=1 Tax=Asparagus officinalis TaxID=4686 RepID=A0A5P1FH60_ASPOF|nr:probable LRR receptor-like serine/threonine-protein kinase At5g48740 [Asparagus officinalis]ONK77646.1 uncharacterized protein A4U43_C02F8980 [Asparagus officinalis]
MAKHSDTLLIIFTTIVTTASLASADPAGFLSLSCCSPAPFTDSSNISWTPDSAYISTDPINSTSTTSLRFFPGSDPRTPICYGLPLNILHNNAASVLVRPSFAYNNYDGLDRAPLFSLSLGTATAASVNLAENDPVVEELVWRVDGSKNTLALCLHPVEGGGSPVISSIEVRPLPEGAYGLVSDEDRGKSSLLRKRYRINCGYVGGAPLRYPFDYYDRIWDVDQNFWPTRLSTEFKIPVQLELSGVKESPPVEVLQTARVLVRRDTLTYYFSLEKSGDYYVVLHFAGITPVSPTFDVLINDNSVSSNYSVKHGEASSILYSVKGIDSLRIMFRNVSFYPQVNAIEIYEAIGIPLECSTTTVSALKVIEQSTGFDLGWQNDPCSPTAWKHVGCDGNLVTSLELVNMDLRVISPTFGDLIDLKKLDLHNTSLSGEIMNLGSLQKLEILNLSFNKLTSFGSDFDTMVNLQILDLQNNSLEGAVPEVLGNLKNLRLLNLENNKLRGVLPESLNKKSLKVRTSGNLCLSFSPSTCNDVEDHPSIQIPRVTVFNATEPSVQTQKHTKMIIVGAAGAVCCALVIVGIVVCMYTRKRKRDYGTSDTRAEREMKSRSVAQVFTYKEIKAATNNFKDIIGIGGFGSIYLGKLSDGKLVAVKVRVDKTQFGADSFFNEVQVLSQVRHQKLVQLEGFCYESKQQILVYEYLPSRSLADNLHGSDSKKATLNWACRLKIAVDAAKGLDYLHNGSNPRIIHRDVKSSNILLDLDMNAKVGDFGLSKQVPQADATHVTTAVKGTAGYLDPDYYATHQLTEKSDVYSFGVVLLELICGREPLSHAGNPDSYNLVLWAKPYLQAGAFEIVDESLKGGFDVESMRKASSIAVRCVERDASERPTMAEVLAELKEAYSIHLTSLSSGVETLS